MLPCVNIAGLDNNFIGVYLSSNPQLLFLTWCLTGSTLEFSKVGPKSQFWGYHVWGLLAKIIYSLGGIPSTSTFMFPLYQCPVSVSLALASASTDVPGILPAADLRGLGP